MIKNHLLVKANNSSQVRAIFKARRLLENLYSIATVSTFLLQQVS
jgi:hypothetical protein